MTDAIDKFLLWESASRDVISTKKAYIDAAGGDVLAGIALSELVFWHLPNKDGDTKLRVKHDGFFWVAVRRSDWWERCRITARQADKAINLLVELGIVVKDIFKFNGEPTVHIRIVEDVFLKAWENAVRVPLANPILQSRKSLNSNNGITKEGNSLPKLSNPLTASYTALPTDLDKDELSAEIQNRTKALTNLYIENIGMPTALMADMIRNAAVDYPAEWYKPAFEIAVKNNARNFAYLEAIWKGWKEHSFGWKPERVAARKTAQPQAQPVALRSFPKTDANGRMVGAQ
jgi:DnaD/phage-associated family protein